MNSRLYNVVRERDPENELKTSKKVLYVNSITNLRCAIWSRFISSYQKPVWRQQSGVDIKRKECSGHLKFPIFILSLVWSIISFFLFESVPHPPDPSLSPFFLKVFSALFTVTVTRIFFYCTFSPLSSLSESFI